MMWGILVLFFLSNCVVLSVGSEEIQAPRPKDITAPKGDARYCFQLSENKNLIRYEVLPGGGWDNLRNKEAGQVVSYNFSHCRTTDDGRYLIPDNTYTVPLKSSLLETFAELFDHWQNYTSTTSTSINVEAGLHLTHFGIDGKFSSESEKVKKQMIQDQSITTRVQARYIRYTAKLQPDSELNPAFRKRLLSIAAHLQLNRTNMARYESQLLVRDFGTHVITSIDAGAAIVQQDQIKSKFTESYSFVKNQILAAASASFFSVASISTEYKHTTTQEMINQYLQNRTHSHINSYGGPVFKPQNFTLNKWGEQIDNELVAMDRSGDPIYFLITPYSLPELPPSVVYKLIQSVKTAVEFYYKFNTYHGCTKMDSPNFSFQANVDDGTCKSKETNFTFGGVYQTCVQSGQLSENICEGLVQKNPLTGGVSCPDEYEAVLINSMTSSKSESRHRCHRCWLFATCCHDNTYHGSAQIKSYWCVAHDHVDQQHGFLFGGVYTSTVGNLVTQTRSCPQFFQPLKMGRDLYVCVSDDYELGFKYSVPFAGFYSCVSGNPLMLHNQDKSSFKANGGETVHSLAKYMRNSGPSHWPMGCPPGFSQHLATVENGCQIDFCVKSNAFSDMGLPAIRRPPFMQIPSDGFMDSNSYRISDDGYTWERMVAPETTTNSQSSNGNGSNDGGITKGAVAGISIFATLVFVVLVIAVLAKYRQKKEKLYKPLRGESDNLTSNEQTQYGAHFNSQPETQVTVES